MPGRDVKTVVYFQNTPLPGDERGGVKSLPGILPLPLPTGGGEEIHVFLLRKNAYKVSHS